MPAYNVSEKTKTSIDEFSKSDDEFKKRLAAFEEAHTTELEQIDQLREDRNAKLDVAVRDLRTEAQTVPYTLTRSLAHGPFSVAKKWSSFYIPERFLAIADELGVTTKLKEAMLIKIVPVVEKMDMVKKWLEENKLVEHFVEAEDGGELTPAVSGPKPIPGFGVQSKERK